jgi:hypothetical protein
MDLLINENDVILDIDENFIEIEELLFEKSDGNKTKYTSMVNLVSVDTVPSEIEVMKYCYNSTDSFYRNHNYRPSTEERIDELETAVANLMGV